MKRLSKLMLGAWAVPLLLVFMLCIGGQSVGRATGLRIQNYIPPNLMPSVEIACVEVQESKAPDLFTLPN
jgi:hypothetical protein